MRLQPQAASRSGHEKAAEMLLLPRLRSRLQSGVPYCQAQVMQVRVPCARGVATSVQYAAGFHYSSAMDAWIQGIRLGV